MFTLLQAKLSLALSCCSKNLHLCLVSRLHREWLCEGAHFGWLVWRYCSACGLSTARHGCAQLTDRQETRCSTFTTKVHCFSLASNLRNEKIILHQKLQGVLHLLYPLDFIWPHVRTLHCDTGDGNGNLDQKWLGNLRNVVVGIIVENTLAAAQVACGDVMPATRNSIWDATTILMLAWSWSKEHCYKKCSINCRINADKMLTSPKAVPRVTLVRKAAR